MLVFSITGKHQDYEPSGASNEQFSPSPGLFILTMVCKLAKDLESAFQGAVIDSIGDAEVGVAAAEDVAGDDQEVAAMASATNSVAVPQGRGEGVERAFGEGKLKSSLSASTTMSRLRR